MTKRKHKNWKLIQAIRWVCIIYAVGMIFYFIPDKIKLIQYKQFMWLFDLFIWLALIYSSFTIKRKNSYKVFVVQVIIMSLYVLYAFELVVWEWVVNEQNLILQGGIHGVILALLVIGMFRSKKYR